MRYVLPVALLAVACSTSLAQCPNGRCGGYAPSFLPAVQPVYRWVDVPGETNQVALLKDGVHVGGWMFDPPHYRPLHRVSANKSIWGEVEPPPVDPPAPPCCAPKPAPPAKLADWQTHGVERANVPASGQKFGCPGGCDSCGPHCPACGGGGKCSCSHAKGHAAAPPAEPLPDFAGKPSLTVVCADAARREKVLADLQTAPALAAYRDKFGPRARGYEPGHSHLAPFRLDVDERFKSSGFAIFAQGVADEAGRAAPTVLYAYDGPEQLAGVLRDVDGTYDPNKVPDAAGIGLSDTAMGATGALVGIPAFALLAFTRLRKHP